MEKYEEPKFIINKNDLLGRGQFTNVYSAYKDNNKSIKYAAKLIPQSISKDESILEQFSNEILITSQFKNKNLLSFISIEEDDEGCNYIIMEYCNGKDLASFIQKLDEKKNRNSLNEEEIQKILKDILYGLSCLHRNSIVHNDIKLENILLNFNTEEDLNNLNVKNCTFKISDFGLSKFTNNENLINTIGGTIEYLPPEIILGPININNIEKSKIDIWAIGILTYKLMFSNHPFIFDYKTENILNQLRENLKNGNYNINLNENNYLISKEFLWFIDSCLKGDFNKRLNSEDLEYSRFVTRGVNKFNYINSTNLFDNNIPDKYLENKGFNVLDDNIITLNIYNEKYTQDEILE